MFKSQLQEYAQKAGLSVPIYDMIKEGPSHEPQFKASVTIHGKVFESPTFFGNLKKAEHAAAEVALATLGKTETGQLHESGLCKNLLQEYAQKCKLPLPVYSVVKSGEVHSPTFTATVEIAGVHYNGGKCKTKKEAEIKAAKTALVAIYADSGASPLDGVEDQPADALDGVEDQPVDEKPALTNVEEPHPHPAVTAVEMTHSEPVSSIVAIVEVTPDRKSGKKRRKLVKVGSDERKQKVKQEQTESAKEVAAGNSGTVVDALEQGKGSPSKASRALTSQVPKQEVPEQELVGSPADSCTAAAAKVASCTNGSAQEQRA